MITSNTFEHAQIHFCGGQTSQVNPKALKRLQIFPSYLYDGFSFPDEFQFGRDI